MPFQFIASLLWAVSHVKFCVTKTTNYFDNLFTKHYLQQKHLQDDLRERILQLYGQTELATSSIDHLQHKVKHGQFYAKNRVNDFRFYVGKYIFLYFSSNLERFQQNMKGIEEGGGVVNDHL